MREAKWYLDRSIVPPEGPYDQYSTYQTVEDYVEGLEDYVEALEDALQEIDEICSLHGNEKQ